MTVTWHWLIYGIDDPADGPGLLVPHCVKGDEVYLAVTTELDRQGTVLLEDTVVDRCSIDMPGMVSMRRPWEEFQLDAFKIEIPSEDLASFILKFEKAKPHIVGKTEFYKLYGFMCALCLSKEDSSCLLDALKERLPLAENRANEFYAVNPLPSQVLRQAAAMTSGLPLEKIGNLGSNKQDRFGPNQKNKGQA